VPNEDDLSSLQKIWYKKLKESGFEDIEDVSSPREYLKTWHSNYFYQRYTPESFEFKQEYYRKASLFLHMYSFEWFPGSSIVNWMEREIWRQHSEGISLRAIALHFQNMGISTNKDKINHIVQRLSEIMKSFNFGSEYE
jgi:hypothetical protein